MTKGSLAKKLRLQSGQRILIVNPPPGYVDELGELPDGVQLETTADGEFDFVQLFAKDSQELDRLAQSAIQAAKRDGLLWICYPKRSSWIETDLTRDEGWSAVFGAGLRPVTQVSVNDIWSALRFRPIEHSSSQDMVDAQYAGAKASLRPMYDRLAEIAQSFGSDVEISPRKTYVALIRKRQFGIIKASTKTRLDLGLKLKGNATFDRLQAAGSFGSGSITHKVGLSKLKEVDEELIGWMKQAYEQVS